ncbi:MAG: polymer-forming cytoskeletal protein, partial [Polaromonas sp.]|nr:polymer-forming cytoskeletal protein [Polaromonas sp.]
MTDETIIIDPVGMNIINRLAPGSKFIGQLESEGGLLIEGTIVGNVLVSGGPLVLMEHGSITGDVTCEDDAYLFGKIHPAEGKDHSELIAGGAVFMAQTL